MKPIKNFRANSFPKKKRPRVELTSESSFDDYCKATYDKERGMFGDKSELSFERQLGIALKVGSDKWKEVDRVFIPESEKRRRGKKGWSKAKRRRKANENRYAVPEKEKEPEFKSLSGMPERSNYVSERKNWSES